MERGKEGQKEGERQGGGEGRREGGRKGEEREEREEGKEGGLTFLLLICIEQLLTVLELESVTVTLRVYCACSSLFRGMAPVEMSPERGSIWNCPSSSPEQNTCLNLKDPCDHDVIVTICDVILQCVQGVAISSSHCDNRHPLRRVLKIIPVISHSHTRHGWGTSGTLLV